MDMQKTIQTLLEDFWARPFPSGVARETRFRALRGSAETVMGMRRTGKTWFCLQHLQAAVAAGLPKEAILHLNFEDDRLLPFKVTDFQTALDVFYRVHPSFRSRRCVLFLDEVQQVQEWEHFVRRVLDTEEMEVILTGSSSKLLSRELATSMRGRSIAMEVFPFSFSEHLAASGIQRPDSGAQGSRLRAEMEHTFLDYLNRGGFPDVRDLEDDLRRQRLQGYVDSVVLRDIIERHHVSDTLTVRALIRHLLCAPGQLFSINKFFNGRKSQGFPCTKSQVSAHLAQLADAYLIYPAGIYSRSEAVRRVNPPKVYAVDTGLLQAFSSGKPDLGFLLENAVYLHLRGHGTTPDYYITQNGQEVDFIYHSPSHTETTLIQVCWSLADPSTREREVRALSEALRETHAKQGLIIHAFDERVDGLPPNIRTLAAWRWLMSAP
jgi:predicted AAA+ superfamily ATPase